MKIIDELNSVDKELQENLKNKKIEEENEKRQKEDEERKRAAKVAEEAAVKLEKRRIEELKKIIEDTEDGLDEPHLYDVKFTFTGGGGYGFGPYIGPGSETNTFIMTEREKRIVEYTGKIKTYVRWSGGYGSRLNEIIDISISNRKPTAEEIMKMESMKKKVSIIKNSDEAESECVLEIGFIGPQDSYGSYRQGATVKIDTLLKNALLVSSISREIGHIISEEQQSEIAKEEELVSSVEKEEKKESEINLPAENKTKISFESIKKVIKKVFGKGERE